MHLMHLSKYMLIAAPQTPVEIIYKYIGQFGSLLSPQDIGTYQVMDHTDFMELVIEYWQKTDGIIQDKIISTEDEVNQFKEHNIKILRNLDSKSDQDKIAAKQKKRFYFE